MLTIGKQFLKDLSKALNNEPSLRPATLALAEQLSIFVLQLDYEERRDKDPGGEWR